MEEEPVPGPQVHVEAMLLERARERAPGSVHDALGRAGGAGGEEGEQRVVEGKPRPLLAGRVVRRPGCQRSVSRSNRERRGVRRLGAVVEGDRRDQGGQPRMSSPMRSDRAVDAASPPSTRFAIRIFGLSWPKRLSRAGTPMSGAALENTAPTAVAAAGRPPAPRCCCPRRPRPSRRGSTPMRRRWEARAPDPGTQLAPGEGLARAIGVVSHHRGVVVLGPRLGPQQVLGVVQSQVREEPRELGTLVRAGRRGRTLPEEPGPLQEERPELRVLLHRELVEGRGVGEVPPGALRAELGEGR